MERWRKFFEGSGTDICTLIDNAIIVAALDCPQELRARRDRIAQTLFTSTSIRCGECDALTLDGPGSYNKDDENAKRAVVLRCGDHRHGNDSRGDCGDNKVASSSNEPDRKGMSNYSYDEAEALTEEIEEESQVVREVGRIRDILANQDESEKQLYECLRRLELMQLSVDTLEATAIGKSVNRLRKHSSKQIRSMAKQLVSGWKDLVDVWVKAAGDVAAAATGASSASDSREAIEDENNGLPSPPLDEGAFLAAQTTSIEMSQFFEGMDDDGNAPVVDRCDNSRDVDDDEKKGMVESRCNSKRSVDGKNGRESSIYVRQENARGNQERGERRPHFQNPKNMDCHSNPLPRSNNKNGSDRHLSSDSNRSLHSSVPIGSSNGRAKQNEHGDNTGQWDDSIDNQIKPFSLSLHHKPKSSDDASISARLETSKRKLQERYKQAHNAKRQRTIQVMDLQDLPKQGPNPVKLLHGKSGVHNHQRFNNRH